MTAYQLHNTRLSRSILPIYGSMVLETKTKGISSYIDQLTVKIVDLYASQVLCYSE